MTLTPQDQINRLKKLYELSLDLSGEPMDIFVKATRIIAEIMDAKVVCLAEIQGHDLYLMSVYAEGVVQTNVGSCPLAKTPCAKVKASKEIEIYQNVMVLFPEASFLKEKNAYSFCGVPSFDSNGEVVAITCLLDAKPREFSAEDQELLLLFGKRLGQEIGRKSLDAERQGMFAKLVDSEQRFRDIAKAAGEFAWEMDATGRLTYLTESAISLFGYKKQDLIGQKPDKLFFSEDVPTLLEKLRPRMMKQTTFYGLELRIRSKPGRPLWVITSVSPIVDLQGRAIGYRGNASEITARKQIEENLKRERNLLRKTLDGLFVFVALMDPKGKIIEANRTPFEAIGIRREDCIGNHFEDLSAWTYDPAIQAEVKTAVSRAQNGETVRYDTALSMGKGVMIIDFSIMPLFDSQRRITQLVACAVDISERKNLETRLRQRQEELYYAQRLTSAGELSAMVSHELNQPLGSINNYIGGALLRFHELLAANPALNEVLEQTLRLSQRAIAVVHGIRALVRKQKGKREFVSLKEVVEDVLIPFRTELSNKRIKINLNIAPTLPQIFCEQIHLQQLLLNLIINGIQAMDTADCIQRKLGVGAKLNANNQLEITVTDTGHGIAPEVATRLFEPFVSTKPDGIGLGLAISRTIVEALGGHISARSGEGQDTTFEVILPLAVEEGQQGE